MQSSDNEQDRPNAKAWRPNVLKTLSRFSLAKLLVIVLVLCVLGGFGVYRIFADSSYTIITDAKAQPVGQANNALQITAGGNSTSTVTASAAFSYINIRAKGLTCSDGVAPIVQLSVDGTAVYTASVTASAYWANYIYSYPAGQPASAGNHIIGISLTNPATVSGCNRTLYVDNIKLYSTNLFMPLPLPDYPDTKFSAFTNSFATCDLPSTVSIGGTSYSAKNVYVAFNANTENFGWSGGAGSGTTNVGTGFGTSSSPCYSIIEGTGPNHVAGHQAYFPNHPGSVAADTNGELSNNQTNPGNLGLNQPLNAGWDVVITAPLQYSAFSGGTISYAVGDAGQADVNYYEAVMSDLTSNQGVGTGKMYMDGFSAGSEIPIFAACYLGNNVSAVITEAGQMDGIAADTASGGYVPCTKPAHLPSIMFVLTTNASYTNSWEGQLFGTGIPSHTTYSYALHITPSHSSLTASDIAAITDAAPNIEWYNALQAAEGWAVWENCGNNLSTLFPTDNTSSPYNAEDLAPGGQPATVDGVEATYWDWDDCTTTPSGQSGDVELYVIGGDGTSDGSDPSQAGAHGFETGVANDGKAWSFFTSH